MNWAFENPVFREDQLDVFVYERGESLAVSRVTGEEVSTWAPLATFIGTILDGNLGRCLVC